MPVLLVLVLVSAGLPLPAEASPARPLFALSDPRLDEASGLALGHRSSSVLYAQNDSGDRARFFALDARTGRSLAICTVPGASNVDWEDLATGPDARGVPSIWLADIGDNDAVRSEIGIYRVDEPLVAGTGSGTATITTTRPEHWRLRYPDGAHDAESLIADPVSHRLYVLTKALLGRSELFAVPATPDPARVQTLAKVGSVTFSFTGTPGGPNAIGQLTATGASMSPDGRLLAIRTYTDAYLWRVSTAGVAAAVRTAPVRMALPAQPQGEGIAIGGGRLLIDSEGAGTAVYELPLPAALDPPSSSHSSSAAPTPSKGAPAQAGSQAVGRSDFPYRRTAIGSAVLVTVVALISVGARRRFRRRG